VIDFNIQLKDLFIKLSDINSDDSNGNKIENLSKDIHKLKLEVEDIKESTKGCARIAIAVRVSS
jgi:hypothetical protein